MIRRYVYCGPARWTTEAEQPFIVTEWCGRTACRIHRFKGPDAAAAAARLIVGWEHVTAAGAPFPPAP